MPYPYTYNPYSYNPNYTPMYQPQTPVAQAQQNASPQSQNTSSGIVWVQGETGAKSYIVAPNTSVLLMDSEGSRFYLKSADASGMPMPLRVFEFHEITDASQGSNIAPQTQKEEKSIEYITREEFERRIEELGIKCGKKKEAIKDE